MSTPKLNVSEDFIDAVAEMLNIGMGKAAASLSQMVHKEVLLSIPKVEFVTRHNAIASTSNSEQILAVSGVCQQFDGAFSGDAILLFPEKQSLALVRAMLGEENDILLENLNELEQEAITEIGNVILNACLSTIADLLHKPIEGSIPEFVQGPLKQLLFSSKTMQRTDNVVLKLKMDFSIEQMAVQGYVSFLMDVESVADFKTSVDHVFFNETA